MASGAWPSEGQAAAALTPPGKEFQLSTSLVLGEDLERALVESFWPRFSC